MAKTTLLPTVTAVRMVWAMTGRFSNDESSKTMATYVEDALKQIEEQAQMQGSSEEKSYVPSAIATMKSSLRSLDTAYKGRTLNFEENEKLRAAYLESVKESLSFGSKAQDFLKSLPTMTVGAAGGVTVAQVAGVSGTMLWGIGLLLAALGYLVNLWFVRLARQQRQLLYVTQDYERGLYYAQYVSRVTVILLGLFLDLERLHRRVFGENYETDTNPSTLEAIIDDILAGVRPTFCPYVHKHMRDRKVTPALWALCESGDAEAVHMCPLWEGQREMPVTTKK
ncbi:MAG: hypothetical protein D6736_02485 [Nitrospinota bacterium]|nr:MAG: hypothetical protein D6736_02485 [Nitrospinota bacterium]